MEHVNSNNVLNVSVGGRDGVLSQDGVGKHNLEAYTVVLSAAAHVLSMLFGGGSSIAVIIAITTRRNINKYSYTLVITLFLTCCILNFVWSPLEVADLIMYHYVQRHPCDNFVATKTALYLFLVLVISLIIVLLSVEGVIRMKNCFGRLLRKLWPAVAAGFALLSSASLTAIFVAKSVQSDDDAMFSYVIWDSVTRSVILALITLAFCLTVIVLFILAALILKETVYWEDGRPHLRQKKLKLAIPEFLISQSNACADNDGAFEHSQSGTPSPSTPKLLSVGNPETASIKGEDASPISELPPPPSKPMGNRLGINMAQVLGRRRHTICQISDSSTASAPADPISKAKQYNYVRKFSVDISALQAQLQNPKIFKEAPFQSDIDLTKKSSENAKPQAPKPLLPLKPLPLKFDEKEEKLLESDKKVVENDTKGVENDKKGVENDKKGVENDKKGVETNSGGLSIPPPPVIMVSNDDAQSNNGEGDNIPNDVSGSKEVSFHQQFKSNANANTNATGVQKPTTLTLKESAPEDPIPAATFESAVSDPSDTESEGQKMARLTVLMCLTFVLNMLPVFVTEVLESTLSRHAFINISTCTLAVSAIQTIVYPHLIACSDDVVHRAVQKLKKRLLNACSCRSDMDAHSHVEDSSSTSQV